MSFLFLLFSAIILPAQEQSAPATAEQLIQRYDAAPDPTFDATRNEDQAYLDEFVRQRDVAWRARSQAAIELARRYPEHPRAHEALVDAMWLRHMLLSMELAAAAGDDGDPGAWREGTQRARQEITQWLAEAGIHDNVRRALQIVDLRIRLLRERPDNAAIMEMVPLIDELRQADPKGAAARELLMWAAQMSINEQRTQLLKQLAAEEPETTEGRWAAGRLRRAEAIGQPFEFSFNEVRSGQHITSEGLKGKILVVDFWGTWCGICLAQMPELKQIYEKYRGQGVEFIGVVMQDPEDAKGKQVLLDYLDHAQVPWPQWYQENGWHSEFAASWGVGALPQVFVIDAAGKLRSLEGRPDEKLAELLPALIEERDAGRNRATGG